MQNQVGVEPAPDAFRPDLWGYLLEYLQRRESTTDVQRPTTHEYAAEQVRLILALSLPKIADWRDVIPRRFHDIAKDMLLDRPSRKDVVQDAISTWNNLTALEDAKLKGKHYSPDALRQTRASLYRMLRFVDPDDPVLSAGFPGYLLAYAGGDSAMHTQARLKLDALLAVSKGEESQPDPIDLRHAKQDLSDELWKLARDGRRLPYDLGKHQLNEHVMRAAAALTAWESRMADLIREAGPDAAFPERRDETGDMGELREIFAEALRKAHATKDPTSVPAGLAAYSFSPVIPRARVAIERLRVANELAIDMDPLGPSPEAAAVLSGIEAAEEAVSSLGINGWYEKKLSPGDYVPLVIRRFVRYGYVRRIRDDMRSVRMAKALGKGADDPEVQGWLRSALTTEKKVKKQVAPPAPYYIQRYLAEARDDLSVVGDADGLGEEGLSPEG